MTTTLEEQGSYPGSPHSSGRASSVSASLRRIARTIPWPICLVTVVAAVLRFAQLDGVSGNQFYDAAVRSMSGSVHNFFFGAFDPAAILSIDKPPLDLWLQVISVKLLGWSGFALKLPEALGGTLAVPLLYDAVRRAVGRPAAIGATVALAVLPESVLTSRSDTMDSVMMLLVIAALWLVIRGAHTGERRAVVLAGVALGLAFNVKLLEALLAAPALALLYLLAGPSSPARRLRDLGLGAAALVGVGLAWAIPASLLPGRHPWPVGSTDGSVWNAMFVFNGFGKVSSGATTKPGGPGPFRLIVSTGWHYDVLFGCVLVAAVVIGLAAALSAWQRRRTAGRGRERDLAWALSVATAAWIVFAVLVFDVMQTVHARYLEALAPALAIAIGYGAVMLAGLGTKRSPSIRATFAALLLICGYTFHFTPAALGWSIGSLIIAVAGAILITRAGGVAAGPARWLLAGLIIAAGLVFPVHETLALVRTNANDSLGLAAMPASSATALSNYLTSRTAGLRYELAVDEPLALAPLLIHDRRPILPLTSFGGIPLTSRSSLLAAVRAGEVRYGLVARRRCGPANRGWAACGPAAQWIRQTGLDVTPQGLVGPSRLYLLSAARAG
ncbi:MAG: ArnT family glycosyltransferase [Solirubrobacteraceae bacterium]